VPQRAQLGRDALLAQVNWVGSSERRLGSANELGDHPIGQNPDVANGASLAWPWLIAELRPSVSSKETSRRKWQAPEPQGPAAVAPARSPAGQSGAPLRAGRMADAFTLNQLMGAYVGCSEESHAKAHKDPAIARSLTS
jgi:hypothetical protein